VEGGAVCAPGAGGLRSLIELSDCRPQKVQGMDLDKESVMGKTRRKFTVGFKQQVVQEIESHLVPKAQAARKYEISAGVIDRWIWKYRDGTLIDKPSHQETTVLAENERLKAKIGELTMQIDLLKKLEVYAAQRRKEDTSVITAKNLAQFQKGAK
jgi:transposase-like protein